MNFWLTIGWIVIGILTVVTTFDLVFKRWFVRKTEYLKNVLDAGTETIKKLSGLADIMKKPELTVIKGEKPDGQD